MEDASGRRVAPWYDVPRKDVVSIEHPCLIKNVDNGIKSLGGPLALTKFLSNEKWEKSVGASLRPDDILAKSLSSRPLSTNNLLLKVTVPRRTGRKRKRGTDDPFVLASEQSDSILSPSNRGASGEMLQSMRDNKDTLRPQVIGEIKETHKFRILPDIQYATTTNPLMNSLRQDVLPLQYDGIKRFKLNDAKGTAAERDVGPMPHFLEKGIPWHYFYRQNPAVHFTKTKTGEVQSFNNQAARDWRMQKVGIHDSIPTKPSQSSGLPPEETLDSKTAAALAAIRKELNKRPLMSRRSLHNALGTFKNSYYSRYAMMYACYTFHAGPFRDCIIKLGVDPRTDHKYRIYQSVSFQAQLDEAEKKAVASGGWKEGYGSWRRRNIAKNADRKSHIFDGKTAHFDGKMWQLCDVTDPLLRKILDEAPLRAEYEPHVFGFYHSGTIAKVRAIMRDKLMQIRARGSEGAPPDEDYTNVVDFPDIYDPRQAEDVRPQAHWTQREMDLFRQIRYVANTKVKDMVKAAAGAVPRKRDDADGAAGSDVDAEGEPDVGWQSDGMLADLAGSGSEEEAEDIEDDGDDDNGDEVEPAENSQPVVEDAMDLSREADPNDPQSSNQTPYYV